MHCSEVFMKRLRWFFQRCLQKLSSAPPGECRQPVSPSELREALQAMLKDPNDGRLLLRNLIELYPGLVTVQGGTTVAAGDVCPGTFGTNCSAGDYAFNNSRVGVVPLRQRPIWTYQMTTTLRRSRNPLLPLPQAIIPLMAQGIPSSNGRTTARL